MKKIACVGYHATGSGVIDDLFREFDNVAQGQYEVESRLLQDPDGISDLEYNLVENPHRLNSGFAIKRFLKYVKTTNRTYTKIFGEKWKQLSEEYVHSLVAFEFQGYWHGDIWLLSPFWRYLHKFRRGLAKISPRAIRKPAYYNYFPWLKSYHVNLSGEEFYARTQDYIDNLCSAMNTDNKEYVVLDQLVAPGNSARYANYAKDLKIIIVDRDPRDVYLHQLNHKDHVLPTDVYQFCQEYRDDRKKISRLPENQCMEVTFEQLIYHYDEYIQKVIDFIGIDSSHWVKPKSHFDPNKSIKNTKLWEKTDKYQKEIEIIEAELSDLLHEL